ncbi:hypothetical protein [Rhodococcus jostii]|uniref:hypothetical protein n=1 Tax=Rhodococcus jostii TaxID=132919 RepID=UPI003639B69B
MPSFFADGPVPQPRTSSRLVADLTAAREEITDLQNQVQQLTRSRDSLNDQLQALQWNGRWGRTITVRAG